MMTCVVSKRNQIDEVRHTREQARSYFESNGLSYKCIDEGDITVLYMMIQKELKISNNNGETSVSTMHMSKRINMKKSTNGKILECFLFMNSHYFTQRECISFNKSGYIGFAGWADDGNTAPIIRAFYKWCDYLKESLEWQNGV